MPETFDPLAGTEEFVKELTITDPETAKAILEALAVQLMHNPQIATIESIRNQIFTTLSERAKEASETKSKKIQQKIQNDLDAMKKAIGRVTANIIEHADTIGQQQPSRGKPTDDPSDEREIDKDPSAKYPNSDSEHPNWTDRLRRKITRRVVGYVISAVYASLFLLNAYRDARNPQQQAQVNAPNIDVEMELKVRETMQRAANIVGNQNVLDAKICGPRVIAIFSDPDDEESWSREQNALLKTLQDTLDIKFSAILDIKPPSFEFPIPEEMHRAQNGASSRRKFLFNLTNEEVRTFLQSYTTFPVSDVKADGPNNLREEDFLSGMGQIKIGNRECELREVFVAGKCCLHILQTLKTYAKGTNNQYMPPKNSSNIDELLFAYNRIAEFIRETDPSFPRVDMLNFYDRSNGEYTVTDQHIDSINSVEDAIAVWMHSNVMPAVNTHSASILADGMESQDANLGWMIADADATRNPDPTVDPRDPETLQTHLAKKGISYMVVRPPSLK